MQVVESPERGLAVGATFTAKEREGYVKEYIEQEGLAMLLNKELGPVLFLAVRVRTGGGLRDFFRQVQRLPS